MSLQSPSPSEPAEPAGRPERVLVVLPALNEAATVAMVVKEVQASVPDAAVLVVDDGSSDATREEARRAGATVVTNVFTLGVGGAMRVGFRYAQSHGHDALVQVDADGQHDPKDIGALLAALSDDDRPCLVIGARFAGHGEFSAPAIRRLSMRLLARTLSKVSGTTLTDVTSGYRAHNRAGIELFARTYPAAYLADTVESLLMVIRAGGRVVQVPVAMRRRQSGTPSQSTLRASAYLLRVALVLALSIIRRQPHHDPAGEGDS
jgi:glycosyltransferase involved in cell wall biosynthesis